ncbi:hypothetical protein [Marinitoga litoralis]|uniref:hypothetical protein n=1 Tax=Marinitoga litoralis TaxID=570855 RepID=UPI001962154B|nr:hypothetical protein [Marinitoga litoralis]MBM7558520.1 hypothetical protein [Marinitoga litoralis]
MKRQRLIYLISLFLTFVPFNLHSGIVILLMGFLFSFLFIRIRKFGMPYYIAFLSLIGVFAWIFFLLNAVDSKNLLYSFNLIAIVVLSYFLPFESKDVIKYTFLFLVSVILLRNLINPFFPLLTFIVSLIEILKDQKNKKLIVFIFSIFIIFTIWNFGSYYNPIKNINFSSDVQLNDNNDTLSNSQTPKTNERLEIVKKKYINNITVEEKEQIKKNNNVIDTIIFINIFIGGLIAIISAFYTWRLFTKKEKRKIIIYIIIFFSAWAIMGTSIAYMNRDRVSMAENEISSLNTKSNNINAASSSKIVDVFREIANSPRSAYTKIYSEIKWIFLIISILLGITIIIFLKKLFNKQKLEEKKIENFSVEEFNDEDIPFLIDEGYKYIRNKYFKSYSHLTPYELLKNINYPKEFELLTNLFVIKEYGEKNYTYTMDEIKSIISKSINYFEKIYI